MVQGTELQLTFPDPYSLIPYLREIEALDMLVMITFFKTVLPPANWDSYLLSVIALL